MQAGRGAPRRRRCIASFRRESRARAGGLQSRSPGHCRRALEPLRAGILQSQRVVVQSVTGPPRAVQVRRWVQASGRSTDGIAVGLLPHPGCARSLRPVLPSPESGASLSLARPARPRTLRSWMRCACASMASWKARRSSFEKTSLTTTKPLVSKRNLSTSETACSASPGSGPSARASWHIPARVDAANASEAGQRRSASKRESDAPSHPRRGERSGERARVGRCDGACASPEGVAPTRVPRSAAPHPTRPRIKRQQLD